jgi:hypothetical protein
MINRTGGSTPPAMGATQTQTPTQQQQQFNPGQYLEEQLANGQSAAFMKAMGSTYATAFDKNVRAAVEQLGPNATQEQVDQVMSKETTNQMVVQSVISMANKQIMAKIKELSADAFEG